MKKALGGILFWGSLISFASLASGAEQIKIGYVDIQRAGNMCEAGKEAQKQMTLELEKVRKVLSGKQKELEKIKEDLEKRGSVLNETVRRERERDYQAKLRELQRLERDSDEDLKRKDRELTDRILKNLAEVIKKLGEEGQYTLILEKNQPTLLYISSALDLTEEVIKISNQKKK